MNGLRGALFDDATNKKIGTMLMAMTKNPQKRSLIPPTDIIRDTAQYGGFPSDFVKCDDNSLRDIKAAGGTSWDCYYLYLMFEDVFRRNTKSISFDWDISPPNEKGFRIARNINEWNVWFSCELNGSLEFNGVPSNRVQSANLKSFMIHNIGGRVNWKTLHSLYPNINTILFYNNFRATVEFDEIIKFAVTNEDHSINVELSNKFPLWNFVANEETMKMLQMLIQMSQTQKVSIKVQPHIRRGEPREWESSKEAIFSRLTGILGSVGFSANRRRMVVERGVVFAEVEKLILKRDNFTIEVTV